ncbi:hypothetical protein F0562_027892 [Nyssa sinensis]|uniref:Uncharacterized protein n=1 Tax=Nyssa sinensis TaxID=561372 RepID=A0A5J5B4V6_9ASTE|nr:hypothetical protein F0562_027892 [Nyssa sinensis]
MEIGATSNDPILDNTNSTSAAASQPESSTKYTEQQKTFYAIQPIKSMEIVSKVHGEDGAAIVDQGAAKSFYSHIISNANISNVHCHHVLSELFLESSLVDISEGDDGVAMDEASIHNTYSAHSWANRVEDGEYIPQTTLDLEAEYGGFWKICLLNRILTW